MNKSQNILKIKGNMKRTVKQSFLSRLVKIAQEANLQNKITLASSLTNQIDDHLSLVRENDVNYKYSRQDFQNDLNDHLWKMAIRTADFYDLSKFDAVYLQDLISKTAEEFVDQICKNSNQKHKIGAYEEKVLGEQAPEVLLEVGE